MKDMLCAGLAPRHQLDVDFVVFSSDVRMERSGADGFKQSMAKMACSTSSCVLYFHFRRKFAQGLGLATALVQVCR